MKFCSYCGYELQDDMQFCPKCGKESVLVSESVSDSVRKLQAIKNIQAVFDPNVITWSYIHTLSVKESADFVTNQSKLSQKLGEDISELLKNITDGDKDIIEREAYLHALTTADNLCKSAAIMFANYSGLQELFNDVTNKVSNFIMSPANAMNIVMNEDYIYKCTASVQLLSASEIVKALDENILRDNNEYRELEKQIAIDFNNAMVAFGTRHIKFFHSPSEENLNANWDLYCNITKGLFYNELVTISDSGWRICLDDLEKNHKGYAFKNSFINKMEYYKNDRKNYDDSFFKNKYFSAHPDEKARLDKLKESCNEQNRIVRSKEQEITVITEKCSTHKKTCDCINGQIEECEKQIKKEEKRLFGKEKAAGRVVQLNEEIERLSKQLNDEKENLFELDSLLDSKNKELDAEKLKLSQIIKSIDDIENLAITSK